MFEALFAFALIVGLGRAAQLRHTWALVGGSLVAYLFVADIASSLAARGQGSMFGFFGSLFIGPGASPLRGVGLLPLPPLLQHVPLLTRAARCAVCWVVSWACFRESSELNPLLKRAYALDGTAMAFVGAGVVDAIVAVVLLWAWVMIGDDAVLVPRE